MNDEIKFKAVSNRVTAFCDKNILGKCNRLVAGVSGGADSLSMLLLLVKYCKEKGIELICAHFNHQIRGKEAEDDQFFVESVCKKLEVEYKLKSMDVISYARNNGISTEMAGRELRYEFFRELAGDNGLIAVAHTKNDKTETIMLNIARGSGTKGLAGILPVNGNIVRPVICLTRQETEFVCRYFGYEFRIDSTNCENDYKRNIVRNIVMPKIEENLKGFGDKLLSLSEIATEEEEFLNILTEEKYKKAVDDENEEIIKISRDLFNSEHNVIKKRIIRMCAEKLKYEGKNIYPGLCGFEKSDAEKAVYFIENGETGKIIKLNKNVKLEISYNNCFIYYKKNETNNKITNKTEIKLTELAEDEKYEFVVGKEHFTIIKTSDYGKFTCKSKDWAVFDFEELLKAGWCLSIRNPESGDYFTPFGCKGGKLLRRFFTDIKVPKEERDGIVLCAMGNNVLFLPGIRRSDVAKVEKKTNSGIIVYHFHSLTEE